MPDETKDLQSTPHLADVARKFQEIKNSIHKTTAVGLGRWLEGPGNPAKIINPFLSLGGPGPGQTYGPGRLRGVRAMGGRPRATVEPKPETPVAKEASKLSSSGGALRALGIRPQKIGAPEIETIGALGWIISRRFET